MTPLLFQLPGSAHSLAFGCVWRAVIDSDDYQAVAKKQAREAKANLLWSDPGEPMFGIAQADPKQASAKTGAIHAAAVAFGKHAGLADAIALLRLPNGKTWVCITRKRMPVSGGDTVCAADEAVGQVTQYLQQNPEFMPTVFGDVETDEFRLHPLSLPSLASLCNDSTRMSRVGGSALKPKYLAVGLITCAVIAYAQYQQWTASQREKRDAEAKASREAELARQQRDDYQHRLDNWLASHQIAGNEAVQSLRHALGEIPAELAGWWLTTVDCTSRRSSAANVSTDLLASQSTPTPRLELASNSVWACTAKYSRTASRSATNLAFDRARPAHWQVHWQPLDALEATFEVPAKLREPHLGDLLPASRVMTEKITAIQEVAPALAGVQISAFGTPKDFPIPPAGVKPEEASTAAAKVMTATIAVAGPLRSFDLLNKKDLPTDWQTVSLTIVRGRSADLRNSAVMATFKGIIYATIAD